MMIDASVIEDLLPVILTLVFVTMILALLGGMTRGFDDPAPKKEKPKKDPMRRDLDKTVAVLTGYAMIPEQRIHHNVAPGPIGRKAKRVTCATCGKRIKVPKPSKWTIETDTSRCPHCGASYHPYMAGVQA